MDLQTLLSSHHPSRDVGNLVMYLSSGDWSSRMPGLRSNSDLAVHYYVGMALKSWYFAGKWPEYGVFLDKVTADAADDRDRNVRELASAWLNNLKRYTDQYERLKRLQDMPEKTVAEVENIDYIGMAESLDIGTVINKKMIAASHIYQMMLDADVSNVKCLTFANADVAEFTVPAGAKITKNLIKDLGLPKGTTIGGMIRNGEGVLVTGDTLIRPGDHVVVFCLSMMIKKIEKFFN